MATTHLVQPERMACLADSSFQQPLLNRRIAPHGDALCPIAMVAYLSAVAKGPLRTFPSMTPRFFVDDGSLAGRDPSVISDAPLLRLPKLVWSQVE